VADNTTMLPGGGGDTLRDVDRAGVKTPVVGLDLGIGTGSEKLMAPGQATMANSIPVALASDQSTLPVSVPGTVTVVQAAAANLKVTASQGGTWLVTVANLPPTQPASIADGADETLGAQADPAATTDTGAFSLVALTKRLLSRLTTLMGQLPAALTGAGNLKVAIQEDSVTLQANAAQVAGTATSVNTGNADAGTQRVVLASNQPAVTVTESNLDGSVTADGGAAPTKGVSVLGKTNDGTAQYRYLPLGAGGRSVIVEGYAGGTQVPVNVNQVGGAALALGQQLAAGSVPVVLTAAQLAALTPPSAVTANVGTTGGLALDATLTGGTAKFQQYDGANVLGTAAHPVQVSLANTGANGTPIAVTASAGTNLNTSALALESGGNLATLAGAVSGGKLQDNVAQVGGTAVATGNGATTAGTQRFTLSNDSTGQVQLAAGSALAGKFGIDQTTPGTTNGVTPVPATSGGPTTARIKSASGTNATSVKASAGQVYGWYLFNNTSSVISLHLYNTAGTPTAGSGTPLFTVPVPANGGCVVEFDMGVPFGTGIGYTITKGATSPSDTDTGACAADDLHGVLLYK